MKKSNVTDRLIGTFLLGLAQTGRAIPKAVFRSWLNSTTPDVLLNPASYGDPKDFALDYQSVRFLKKFPRGLVSARVREQKAIEKFLDCEGSCGESNHRILHLNRCGDAWLVGALESARQYIHSVLGDFSWDLALPHCDFGPGASIGIKRSQSHVVNKIGNPYPTVTGECLALLKAYMAWAPRMGMHLEDITICRGSKVTTVPKDAKIDRVIAIEPQWNMFFQKGIGGLIRRRLERAGLGLDTQATRNREFARIGSRDGTFATIDLSSASDSIGLELVRFLLPPDWFTAMMITRSHRAIVNGEEVFLRKISSMGNGFTFELESLIFLALARAVSPHCARSVNVDVATFGDDIICRPEIVNDLTAVLNFCGFKVNPEKSFTAGPFRESCGGHFFDGFDVTPYHLDKEIMTTHDTYWFANSVRLFASRLGASLYCDAVVKEAYDVAIGTLPQRLRRIRIPPGCGDDGLVSCFDEVCPTPYFDKKLGAVSGFRYNAFARIPIKKRHDDSRALSVNLYAMEKGRFKPLLGLKHRAYSDLEVCDSVQSRCDEEVSFRLRVSARVLYRQWSYIGPWV